MGPKRLTPTSMPETKSGYPRPSYSVDGSSSAGVSESPFDRDMKAIRSAMTISLEKL